MRPTHTGASPDRRVAAPASLPMFLVCHCLAGVVAGWTVVAGLLWSDVAGVGRLVMTSDLFPVPLVMLLGAFAITFGSVAMAARSLDWGDTAVRRHNRTPLFRDRNCDPRPNTRRSRLM